MASVMRQFLDNSYLFGGNAPFIEDLYEKYLANPQSVDDEWRDYFDRMQMLPGNATKDVARAPVEQSFVERAKRGELGGGGGQMRRRAHDAGRARHARAAAGRGAPTGHGIPDLRRALGHGRSAEAHGAAAPA